MSDWTSTLDLRCPGCNVFFASQDEATRHICPQRQAGASVFHCRSCRMLFHDKSQLSAHLLSHGVRDNYKKPCLSCWVCGKTLADTWNFKRHMSLHQISNFRGPMPVSMLPPGSVEMTPRCRLCGQEVQREKLGVHSAEHFQEIFELVRPRQPETGECSNCACRRLMARAVVEMMEGREGMGITYLRKITGNTPVSASR